MLINYITSCFNNGMHVNSNVTFKCIYYLGVVKVYECINNYNYSYFKNNYMIHIYVHSFIYCGNNNTIGLSSYFNVHWFNAFLQFPRVFSDFTRCYPISPDFTRFHPISPDFTRFHPILPDFLIGPFVDVMISVSLVLS